MKTHAIFSIVRNIADLPLIIQDECVGKSVTNDAEFVVKSLFDRGFLNQGRKLYYYDSDGRLDEIIHQDGKFRGFASVKE